MNELLDLAIAAHGGMDRWRQLRTLRVRFSAGGLLFAAKGQRRALDGVEALVDVTRPRTSLFPYPAPGRRGVFEPERVWVESDRGELLDERQQPRAAFGRLRQRLWWDQLDVLYFAGYALWNYMCLPFLLARPGFVVDEIEPWAEGGERWRRLRVTFPADVPTHSPRQVFYFDARAASPRGLHRRHRHLPGQGGALLLRSPGLLRAGGADAATGGPQAGGWPRAGGSDARLARGERG